MKAQLFLSDYNKDFEYDGIVSIWGANFSNEDELFDYIDELYSNEGDMFSKFTTEFRHGYLDNDFMDSIHHGKNTVSAFNFLKGISFSLSFYKKLEKHNFDLSKYNSVICLFDFKYIIDQDYIRKNQNIDFLCSIAYDDNSNNIE